MTLLSFSAQMISSGVGFTLSTLWRDRRPEGPLVVLLVLGMSISAIRDFLGQFLYERTLPPLRGLYLRQMNQ
jgi:hypothetical protein